MENIILKAENHSLAPHRSEIQSHPSQHTYTYIRAGLLLLAEVFSDFQHNPTIPRKYTLAFEHLSLYNIQCIYRILEAFKPVSDSMWQSVILEDH